MHQTPGYQQPYDPPQQQWHQQAPQPHPHSPMQPPTPPPPTPPTPTPPTSRRKSGSKMPLLIVIAVVVIAAVVGAIVLLTGGDDSASEAKPAKSGAAAPAAEAPPTPTSAQRAVYLAALREIAPELAENEDRAIRQGGLVCQRILKPEDGGMSLPQFTVAELSKGGGAITRVQAFKVIIAVKAWCSKS
ncbi:hypothetical protein [Microtetraspora malaysiensis]|uniref:hypothetical protein n=1 Tax=Microtetraspora malaysiensis TaxID=161358 RepID=UPI003D9016CD